LILRGFSSRRRWFSVALPPENSSFARFEFPKALV
jgi:hypothetical protein